MAIFRLKYRDTLPALRVKLLKPDGSPAEITGSTAWKLHIRLNDGTVLTRTMTKLADDPAELEYAWLAADWDAGGLIVGPSIPLQVGQKEHEMEYEVLGAGGARQTYPNEGYDTLRIWQDLGQG